jgi:membrane peptidoglycan carboxypeptidase
LLRQGLVGVVNEPKGTAYRVHSREIEVAGKTGTAQVRRNPRHGEAISAYDQNDHAWFVGFAPAGNPKIAFAVLIEHGGHGGEVAAPAAMEIVKGYFDTVAPDQKNAPRLGLPRHKLFHLDEDQAAARADAVNAGEARRGKRERAALPVGEGDGAGAGDAPTAAPAPIAGGAGAGAGAGTAVDDREPAPPPAAPGEP